MECIESSGAWLVLAFHPLPPAPSLPCLRRHPRSSRIWSKTRRKGVTPRPQMTPQRSFSLLPLSCELSRSCVMDEGRGFSSRVLISRERGAISVLRTFRTRVSVSLHLRSPVCRAISLDATRRDFSRCGFSPLCFSRRCVRVKLTSFNARFNQDGRCPVNVSVVTSLLRCYVVTLIETIERF